MSTRRFEYLVYINDVNVCHHFTVTIGGKKYWRVIPAMT